jgi:hypothetical protein
VVVTSIRVSMSSSPLRRGEFTFLLYAKERVNYKYAALFSYMVEHGVQCRRVGGRLDSPCHDLAIMAYLVPKQWWLRGSGCGG